MAVPKTPDSIFFADTHYWVAVVHPRDSWHDVAKKVTTELEGFRVVTSELVLVEVLNFFARYGRHLRQMAEKLVKDLQDNPNCEIVAGDKNLFAEALIEYSKSHDKSYSFTDCSSFVIMSNRKIMHALTHDDHFNQAGFVALLRDNAWRSLL